MNSIDGAPRTEHDIAREQRKEGTREYSRLNEEMAAFRQVRISVEKQIHKTKEAER
jgi:hypothetical protein